jgi:hypothetical protein
MPSGSPMMLASPFLGSSVLQRASAMQEGGSSFPSRSLPIPTIQREMASPERKRSRRVDVEDEDEEELEDTDEE